MCCSSVGHKVSIPGLHVILLASLYPLPSVWLGWPWSPKSRSSPLKIRLLISPPVECVMPLHGYLLSHIILLVTTTCLLLFQDLTKMHNNRVTECCGAVFLIHCLALAWAWLNVRASILASVSVFVTKTRYDEANHKVNIHPGPATKCSIMLS